VGSDVETSHAITRNTTTVGTRTVSIFFSSSRDTNDSAASVGFRRAYKDRRAGGADQQADIEGKIAGFGPAPPHLAPRRYVSNNDHGAEEEYDAATPISTALTDAAEPCPISPSHSPPRPAQRRSSARRGRSPPAPRTHLARNPASLMSRDVPPPRRHPVFGIPFRSRSSG